MRQTSERLGDGSRILELGPPFATYSPGPGPRPLGTILVADARRGAQGLLDALLTRRAHPWCPVCVVAPPSQLDRLAATLTALEPEYAGCATLPGDPSIALPEGSAVVSAVRRRLPPTAITLGNYAARRVGPSADPFVMAGCLSPNAGATVSRWVSERTMSRQAAAVGPLAVRDWAGIGFVVLMFARHPLAGCSVERAALHAGIDPRSLRRWFRLCTDREWRDAVELPGWEWLLESALRKWGYIRGAGAADSRLAARVPVASRPFGVALSRSGRVYVTRAGAASLAVGTAEQLWVDDGSAISVGAAPTDVAFAPSGERAYVTNQLSGTVGVIDVRSGRQTASVRVDGAPYKLFVAPDESRIYASNNHTSVFVIDAHAHTVVGRVDVGDSPNSFALHPGRRFLYVSSWVGRSVAEIDLESTAVTRRFDVGGIPQGLAVSNDGHELYVANEAGRLDVWSLVSGENVDRITLGGGGFGLTLTPDGSYAYVTLPQAGRVQVLHLPSRAVVKTLDTGGMPRRLVFDSRSDTAIVPNEGGWVDFIG